MIYSFEDFSLNVDQQELRRGCDLVEVEPQVLDLLQYLIRNRERIVTKNDLIAHVWNGRVVSDSTLTSRITNARRAVGDNGLHQRLIRTIARKGIRFVGEIEEIICSSNVVSASVTTNPIFASSSSISPLSLVVLPFENLSTDPEHEYFADCITEDLTTGLSRLSGSVVIARNSALTYKGKRVDVRLIDRELGVRYALEGTLRHVGDNIRVTARLNDTASGASVWSETLEADRNNFVRLEDDIVVQLARTLSVTLVRTEGERSIREHPTTPDAIDLVMRARALLTRGDAGETQEMRRLFREALQLDDRYAEAWAGLAQTYAMFARFSTTREDDLRHGTEAAETAVMLAPNMAWAHWAKGLVLFELKYMEHALREFELAVELDPSEMSAQGGIGAANIALGRPEQAFPPLLKAMQLSPRDGLLANWEICLGVAHMHLGNDQEALIWLAKSVDRSPRNPFGRLFLAGAFGLVGREAEAKREIAALERLQPGFTLTRFRAVEPSDAPAFRAQRERIYDGLRRAGLPE